jgi:hypothetical protein
MQNAHPSVEEKLCVIRCPPPTLQKSARALRPLDDVLVQRSSTTFEMSI